MATTTFYIDESGHTGDLLVSGAGYDFAGQPHFVLAAIGPTATDQTTALLGDVAARHRLKMDEVKSSHLQTRPKFVKDLVVALIESNVPMFVEAVDKRFYLIIQIVNTHILPPGSALPDGGMDQALRNLFADFLYDHLSDVALDAFLTACREDSASATRASLHSMRSFAMSTPPRMGPPFVAGNVESILAHMEDRLTQSISAFEQALAHDAEAHRQFLPVPDAGKRDQTYWVLPNYSSFTNLYARINRFQGGKLSDVMLVHDEQAQYDAILRDAKSAVETFVNTTGHSLPSTTYAFDQTATLVFEPSHASAGIMIADVVAGTIRRVLRDHLAGTPIHPEAWAAFMAVWHYPHHDDGPGLNLVISNQTNRALMQTAFATSTI